MKIIYQEITSKYTKLNIFHAFAWAQLIRLILEPKMETYTSVEVFNEYGSPLFILIKLYIYQDESLLTGRLFWTFDILNIKGTVTILGEALSCSVNEKEFKSEIEEACLKELESFKRAA